MNAMGTPDGAPMVSVSAAITRRSTEGASTSRHRAPCAVAGKSISQRRSPRIGNRENHAGAEFCAPQMDGALGVDADHRALARSSVLGRQVSRRERFGTLDQIGTAPAVLALSGGDNCDQG
jgi:hypothetical protein